MELLNKKVKRNIKETEKIIEKNNPEDIEIVYDLIKNSLQTPTYTSKNSFVFIAFKSINNVDYLIYIGKKNFLNNNIISYNLNNNQILNLIRRAHIINITNLKYFLDEINQRELIMSISSGNNNIKIWDLNNWQCIINYKHINNLGFLYSACFLKENNEIYIITSNNTHKCPEYIKIFDLKGNKIKEIYFSDDNTLFIDVYYEDKIYIITGNSDSVKSYDYTLNKLYFEYKGKQEYSSFSRNIIINKKDEIIRLIDSNEYSIIIWNFHTGMILNKIYSDYTIKNICLWNNDYLFTGGDGFIRLLQLNNNIFIKTIEMNVQKKPKNINLQKIIHPKYGECLLYKNENEEIKIILNKNKYKVLDSKLIKINTYNN